MKFLKSFVFAVIYFTLFVELVHPLDRTSIRIKSLGESMQGIVPDDYTDMLANPARQLFWTKSAVIGKVGLLGNPLTLGYKATFFPVVLLLEGKIAENQNEDISFSNYSGGSYYYQYQTIHRTNTNNNDYNLVFMSGFGSTKWAVGLGFFYQKSPVTSRSDSISRELYVDKVTGQVIRRYDANYLSEAETDSQNHFNSLGFYFRKDELETDIVLKALFSRVTSLTHSRSTYFVDEDPDGNGKTYYGSNTLKPNTSESSQDTLTIAQPLYNTGIGFELRQRKLFKNKTIGYLLSFSWQPTAINEESGTLSQTQTVLGSTVTLTSSRSNLSSINGRRNSYSGGYSIGGMWKLGDRFRFGSAIKVESIYIYEYKSVVTQITTSTPRTTNIYDLTSLSGNFAIPLSVEVFITNKLTLRANVTPSWSGSSSDQIVSQLYYDPTTLKSKSSKTSASYAIGMGYEWHGIKTDIFTTSDLFNISNLQLQISYLF